MIKRSTDPIVADIEQAILLGDFSDGQRLDEAKLAQKHKVSRTPVREALRMLAASGLVELIPNRGAFVRFPDLRQVVEMFEVMGELESMAARLAAKRISATQCEALVTACAACAQAEKRGDTHRYYIENESFHHLIYAASGNLFLVQEATRLYRRLQPIRRLQLQANGRLAQSMNEHAQILDAIQNADSEKAATLLRDHIVIQGEKFNDLLVSYNKERPAKAR